MTQTNHGRKIGSIAFASGGRQTLEIDRAGVLMSLALRLTFTITNSGTPPVTPLYQALAGLIKRIEILVGGRDTVWSIRGDSLAARLFYENQIAAQGMDATVVLTASAATTYDIVLPLDFFVPNGRRPDDTGLDLRRVSTAIIAVTWGNSNCSDIFTTPNSAAISNVSCTVEGDYLLGAPDTAVYLVRAIDQVERELTGTSDNFDVIMDKGSGLFYRGFQVEALAAGVGHASIVNSIKLEAGPFSFRASDALHIQARNRMGYGVAPLTGVYMLPQSFFGQGTTWINTAELTSDLKLIFNATKQTGTNIIRVTREAVRPLKLA
jgi:hypothetical protein